VGGCKVKREGGRVGCRGRGRVGAYHGDEKSQVGGSLKKDGRMDDGESLYTVRKRGGGVVAAGNNDLDRHFTGKNAV
jgi:hypothetical protein